MCFSRQLFTRLLLHCIEGRYLTLIYHSTGGKKKHPHCFLCSLAQPAGSIQHLQSPPTPAEHTGAFSLRSHHTSSPQPAEKEGTASSSSELSGCSLTFAPSDATGRWEGKLQRVPICKALLSLALQNRETEHLSPPPPFVKLSTSEREVSETQ